MKGTRITHHKRKKMESRSSGDEDAGDGADVAGDTLQVVVHVLPQLQEAPRLQRQRTRSKVLDTLRLHQQETQRMVHATLRLQQDEEQRKVREVLLLQQQETRRMIQETLSLKNKEEELHVAEALRVEQWKVREALRLQEQRAAKEMREMERKLQEKEDTIRALQQQLQERQERVMALEERMTASLGSGGEGGLQRMEGFQKKMEKTLQSEVQILPRGESVLRINLPKQLPSTRASLPTVSSSTFPSAAGHQSAAADEEEDCARRRMELRVQEATKRVEKARNSPSPLGKRLGDAAEQGHLNVVRDLIDVGADVNYPNILGCTPLQRAVYLKAHAGVVSLLLQRGADVNAADGCGFSALHWAVLRNSADSGRCVNLLVGAGADVNVRDKNGETPLHWAVNRQNEEAVRALLAAGARKDLKPWAKRWINKTPVEIASTLVIRDLLRL